MQNRLFPKQRLVRASSRPCQLSGARPLCSHRSVDSNSHRSTIGGRRLGQRYNQEPWAIGYTTFSAPTHQLTLGPPCTSANLLLLEQLVSKNSHERQEQDPFSSHEDYKTWLKVGDDDTSTSDDSCKHNYNSFGIQEAKNAMDDKLKHLKTLPTIALARSQYGAFAKVS